MVFVCQRSGHTIWRWLGNLPEQGVGNEAVDIQLSLGSFGIEPGGGFPCDILKVLCR